MPRHPADRLPRVAFEYANYQMNSQLFAQNYLQAHEAQLRARESGKAISDKWCVDKWYGYIYPNNLSRAAAEGQRPGPIPAQGNALGHPPRKRPSPERATQPPRPHMARPYRAGWYWISIPRALPWAGMARTFGAENAPSHPIRNRLLRLTADSPDFLAIIKAEGQV